MSRSAGRIALLERVNSIGIVLLLRDRRGRGHRRCLLHASEEGAIYTDPFVSRNNHRLAMLMHMSHSLLAAYGSGLRVVMGGSPVG
jgi:hypothetical protein